MNRLYCDICGDEIKTAKWAPILANNSTGPAVDRVLGLVGAEDVCKRCGAASRSIDLGRLLRAGILRERGICIDAEASP